ncbi:hypothetical protein [Streptomyces sp. NPDC047525]|uniref:hypothetical protein n=1 Tax=Streptomyces sp. NPDC047525 TaxID=3155264 RepID=UPI0033ED1142
MGHEYVAAVDDDGDWKFAPEVSERARAKLNQIAVRMTRPPKQQTRPLAQLRERWKTSAVLTSGVTVDVINSLLGRARARAAAAAIRSRVAAVAVDVTAKLFVMNKDGFFHRWHLLAEARRHLALVLRGRRREPGLDEDIVEEAIATHRLDISEQKTPRGHRRAYRLCTARWSLTDPPSNRRRPTCGRGRRGAASRRTPARSHRSVRWCRCMPRSSPCSPQRAPVMEPVSDRRPARHRRCMAGRGRSKRRTTGKVTAAEGQASCRRGRWS